ncbi:MAG: S26 family signal peptidase [Dermatophilaceae bacterium]|nr:S26 family signal peptidase [Intrasporangiaceae bacterium]
MSTLSTPRRRRGPGLVRVAGPSMEPTLHDRDLLLVWWGRPAAADRLVVLRHPAHSDVLAVKRAAYPDPADERRWWVERDNPRAGSDSWTFGSVADSDILARVLIRLPRLRTRR